MRILHVGKYYFPQTGGTELYTQQLVQRHSKLASVEVVASNVRARREVDHIDGATVTRLPTIMTVASMPISVGLTSYLAANCADIIHLHMPNPLAAFSFLRSKHRGKLILTHHADTVGRELIRSFTDPIVRAVHRRASAIIVSSQRYLESSTELTEVREKCHVIPLGVDLAQFDRDDRVEVDEFRHRYGPNLVACIGRLVEFKGFQYAIEALAKVSSVKLLIAGEGPYREQLATLVHKFGLEDRVHFLGSVQNERISGLIKACQLVLFPSTRRTESFGYVQLEALACGIPVINTALNTGAEEVSLHGVTGLTVPPKNSQALAEAMNRLLSDDGLRTGFGRAGRQRVFENYGLDQMSGHTFELYLQVLGSERRQSALENSGTQQGIEGESNKCAAAQTDRWTVKFHSEPYCKFA